MATFKEKLLKACGTVLDVDDVARVCLVSKPTAERWMSGKSSPHPLIQPASIAALLKARKRKEERK